MPLLSAFWVPFVYRFAGVAEPVKSRCVFPGIRLCCRTGTTPPRNLRRLTTGAHPEFMAKTTEQKGPIEEGRQAPEIELETDSGQPFRLSSLKGKNVVLYFYPKADTPGCTKEACEFRDTSKKFTKADTVIVGISPDASKAQAKFKDKFDLPFVLLADVEHKTSEDYGVWKEKSMYGK